MKFIAMDLLQMDFQPDIFTCFLDKGTLDALMSDKDAESQQRAEKMFQVQVLRNFYIMSKRHNCFKSVYQEIDRVLKIGGRYLCISLLQEHILKFLLSYFHKLGN